MPHDEPGGEHAILRRDTERVIDDSACGGTSGTVLRHRLQKREPPDHHYHQPFRHPAHIQLLHSRKLTNRRGQRSVPASSLGYDRQKDRGGKVPIESSPGLFRSATGDLGASCIEHVWPDAVSVTSAIPELAPNSAT